MESFWARERTRNVFWGRVWRIPFVRGRSLVAFSEGKPCMKNPPYRAQNEAYKEVDGEKRRKALPVKELCVMAASGRAKRNVYIGLHSV